MNSNAPIHGFGNSYCIPVPPTTLETLQTVSQSSMKTVIHRHFLLWVVCCISNVVGSTEDGLPFPFRPKKEEKLPLTQLSRRDVGAHCSPFGRTFDAIVLCMFLFTMAVTVALVVHIVVYEYQETKEELWRRSALSTDSYLCGAIGVDVLKEGGSAVDAAIAMQICSGVVSPHLTGIGGGGLMTIYRNGGQIESRVIDFRGAPPSNPTPNPSSEWLTDTNATTVSIPGFLRGLKLAHQLYGKLSWRRLVEPAVVLAAEGFRMGDSLHKAVLQNRQRIFDEPLLREVFVQDGTVAGADDRIRWKRLSETLAVIAEEGPDALYTGSLVNATVRELAERGVRSTAKDLENYFAKSLSPLYASFRGLRLLAPPSDTAGLVFLLTVELLEALRVSLPEMENSGLHYDTLIRAIEVASATMDVVWSSNWTANGVLGKTNVMKLVRDYFDSHENESLDSRQFSRILPPAAASSVVVSDSEDLLVAVVTNLASPFGSGIITSSGIIWNDALGSCDGSTCQLPSTILPIVLADEGAPCGTVLAAVSADYQMLAQTIVHLDPSSPLKSAVKRPKLRVIFDEASNGVKIGVNNNSEWSAVLLDDLQRHGHVILRNEDVQRFVAAIRILGDTTQVYADPEPEGFQVVI